ncbi:DegT/DnrJ/EryC1/StrS family aminotransferase [Paenibacillus frigoriresistens]|uniref:DegT/DnrJ/EryC1/StrS family aminotransferase n=1 Tax=Paenibacillus alginolyticus TaxID=59839 RepID=UPI001564566D|nr:DegT/DnrJ/EryC1/StrS family aminotransferase [Paenibacillus frigoriresistens]NRF93660.1 DegT/DnrJ/EryC1/StrS family aminotransferase [Paenibacillus frigoriresistens]
MSKLALFGNSPIREKAIPWVNTMGPEETQAVMEVMESGTLSAFLGRAGEHYLGGPKVKQIEADFAAKFGVKHGISVNSATTALHAAIAACEIGPGDEVIVTPYTMVATASAVLMNNAVPIFADISSETFNLNPSEIEKWITPRTKAIMVANMLGLTADLPEIVRIAKKYGLYVIEDNAQSPGATINGKFAGSFGDISIFSLNYHKVIHSGEGGIILTDNDELARRCQMIRNHGEMAADDLGDYETVVLGNNYRMTELHAAIGIEQLKKLDDFLVKRRSLADNLTEQLKTCEGLKGVYVPEGYEHSYYVYPILFDKEVWGINRATFLAAMKAEGFPLGAGLQKPIYLLPMYQHKKVYNQTTFPFSLITNPIQEYKKGICPIVEEMFFDKMIIADLCREPFTSNDIDDFIAAVAKVWAERGKLHEFEKSNTVNT